MEDGAQQGPPEPKRERTLLEKLALYSRGPVELECKRYSEAVGETDLSVSGRLADAAKLCALVREWLAIPPMERPVVTLEEFRKAADYRLPSERR